MSWRKIGSVGVDTGEIVIADPEYVGNKRMGVRFSPAWGDGIYPVYARKNDEGRIVEVRILTSGFADQDKPPKD